jgi:signal transduction histidine kinase
LEVRSPNYYLLDQPAAITERTEFLVIQTALRAPQCIEMNGNSQPPETFMITKAAVLIIDDEVANVRLLERILKRANCRRCIGTTDPREALALFEKEQPDLILTDWLMPYHDGSAVIEQIRGVIGSDDYVPIVVLTADVTSATRRRALAAGATDFLTKPFDQFEVLLRVDNLLATRFAHVKVQEQNSTLEQNVRERTIDLEKALTELKQTQRQIVQQERLAALGTMAGGIAHDFNNALSVIMGFSDILLDKVDDGLTKEQAQQPLATILTAAEDASKIVGRLREFYRRDNDTEAVRVPVRFNELIEQAVLLTKPRWETQSRAYGIPIDVTTDLGNIGFVLGDPASLREMLTNLIFNAVDAMPKGGTINLRTIAADDTVRIEVSDTGTGMSDEVRERCLEPFFTTKGKKGTGLGLAMVFGIVKRHGGCMDIESALGKGTTFIIRFPTTAAPPEETEKANESLLRPLKILVVDDQPVLCQLMCEFLENDFHSVETATNGREALEKFRAEKFDLVITDQIMAEMNGEELAREIKRVAPEIPVILVTGFAENSSAAGEKHPAIDYILAKPMSHATLRRALSTVMRAEPKSAE